MNAYASIPCGIWLAPSTIDGAGLGLFAGKDFMAGDHLQESGDIVIPIIDIALHNQEKKPRWTRSPWAEYTWSAKILHCDHEGKTKVNALSPGIGACANSFLPVTNVREAFPRNDAAGLHRSKDPGAGAFTTYYDRYSTATRNIQKGEELFVDYGAKWFEARTHLGPIPLFGDLDAATQLYQSFQMLRANVFNVSDLILDEIWDIFVQDTAFKESRTIGAFHHERKEDEFMLLENATLTDIRIEQTRRSLEWFAEHGTCADHIKVGPSTIRQAGRGAFASRDLPAGTIVTQIPLIHLAARTRFDMYRVFKNKYGHFAPSRDNVIAQQLLLNYCFGHEQMQALLCPYGPMASFINHNQTLANVKLRWADPARSNHVPELLQKNLRDADKSGNANLAFELVVSRDVAIGDEIFLDYGDSWERAWQEHVKQWKPGPGADHYMSAMQLNAVQEGRERLRTVFEAIHQPYPPNVHLQCHKAFMHTERWRNAFYDSGARDKKERFLFDLGFGRSVCSCDILRYEEINGTLMYTAALYNDEPKLLERVPQEAFLFVDNPYTTDMSMETAFRHEIMIPDDMFPEAWRGRDDTKD